MHHWKEMLKEAKKYDIKFGFELFPGDSVYNTETFIRLKEGIGDEGICCTLDIGNISVQGINPINFIEILGKSIVNVHAKDEKINKTIAEANGIIESKGFDKYKKRAWNYRIPGYGHDSQFWNEIMSSLRLYGYEGIIHIENEDPFITEDEALVKSVSFLKNIIFNETI